MKGHDLLSGMANVPADMERVGRGLVVRGCLHGRLPACHNALIVSRSSAHMQSSLIVL